MNQSIKNILLISLVGISITACGQKREDGNKDKEPEQVATYEVDAATWMQLIFHKKAIDPNINVTITSKNAGKLFNNIKSDDIVVTMEEGRALVTDYVNNYFEFNSYNESSGKYDEIKFYQDGYYPDNHWEYQGSWSGFAGDVLNDFITPCVNFTDMAWNNFEFNGENNEYRAKEDFKSTSRLLPNDNEYTIKNLKIQFKNNKIQYIDYLIQEFNLQITSTFASYGTTKVERPNIKE